MALTAGNPQTPLGTLNRLRGSIVLNSFPALNVTASFLGREGINLSWEGDTTTMIPQMAGVVTSPEPYQMVTVEIHLVKSQSLAAAYEQQRLTSSQLGDMTVTTDATTMPKFNASNCSLQNIGPIRINGEDAGYIATIRGTYYINNSLWSLT